MTQSPTSEEMPDVGPYRAMRSMTSFTPDDEALQSGLRGLSEMLLSETNAETLLDSVTSLAAEALPGCHAASISLTRKGRPTTPVCSAEIAREADLSQYDTNQGPCLSAIETGEIVRTDSFLDEDRWPAFSKQAASRGLMSALSLPLRAGDEVIGALNLYSRQVENFRDGHDRAALFARQASVTLSNAQALRRAEELAQQLAIALESRDVIGQAKGIIMTAEGVSSEKAFDVLRRASQRSNRKLHDVAREIVERRERARTDPEEGFDPSAR